MQVAAEYLYEMIDRAEAIMIDVRDYDYGHGGTIAGARHINYYERYRIIEYCRAQLAAHPPRRIVVFCQNGLNRSVRVQRFLAAEGIDALVLYGGYSGVSNINYKI